MYHAPVSIDAAGVPTIGAPVADTLIGGMIKKVTTLFDSNTLVVPCNLVEKLAVEAVPVAIGGAIQKYVHEGQVGVPFLK